MAFTVLIVSVSNQFMGIAMYEQLASQQALLLWFGSKAWGQGYEATVVFSLNPSLHDLEPLTPIHGA